MIAASMDLLSTGTETRAELFPSEREGTAVTVTEIESGGTSPVYSPFSESSTSGDSGVLSGGLSEEDQFLAGLFGTDFPLLSELDNGPGLGLVPNYSQMPEVSLRSAPTAVPVKQEQVSHAQLERNRKNAEAARANRQKKKQYVLALEKQRASMKAENVVLKTKCSELQATVKRLQTEVQYLRSVLENQSTLSSLIQNIPTTPGVKLTSSFSRKRPNEASQYSQAEGRGKRAKKEDPMTGGVCLHVSKNVVSLEFCASCSQQAAGTAQT